MTKPARALTPKTPDESPAPVTPVLVPQVHGGAILQGGNPGNKGGPGRPPNWLKRWCDRQLKRGLTRKQVRAILADKDHDAFATMWRAVAERAHGRVAPAEDESSGNGTTINITFNFAPEGRRFDADG